MKRALFLFLILFTTLTFAQEDKYAQIKAMKTAYITEKLDLSPTEAEKFWPVYNSYRKELWRMSHDKYKTLHENYRCSLDEIDDTKAIEMLALAKKKEKEESALREIFQEDLLKVLPAPKVFMLRRVEEGFKRKLLKWYSENKE